MRSKLVLGGVLASAGLAFIVSAGEVRAAGPTSVSACGKAVTQEVRYRHPYASRIELNGGGRFRPISTNETAVSGSGQFASVHGRTHFNYSCIYNSRQNATYAVNVRAGATVADNSKPSTGAVIGAVVGVAIAAAVIESAHHKNEARPAGGSWFSPEPGVSCSTARSVCYRNGHVAPKWTRRVFIDKTYAN